MSENFGTPWPPGNGDPGSAVAALSREEQRDALVYWFGYITASMTDAELLELADDVETGGRLLLEGRAAVFMRSHVALRNQWRIAEAERAG